MSTRRVVAAIKGWVREAISKVAEVNPVTLLSPTELDNLAVPFYEMAAIDEYSGKLRDAASVPLRDCRTGKTKFQNGDVLFAKITPCVQNRKSALINGLPGNFACGSSEFYVLRPGKRVMPEYLFYFIRQDWVIQAAVESFTGTSGRQRVPRTFWDRLEIPLPPLPVQERIVQILQKADEIRQKRKQALELVDKILPALFLEMFGDPATNPKGWPLRELGELISDWQNGFATGNKDVPSGVPQVRMQNITTRGWFDKTLVRTVARHRNHERYLLQEGDVLFNNTNSPDLVGKTTIFREQGEWYFSNHISRIRPATSVTGEYLWSLFLLLWTRGRFRSMCRQWVNQASVSREELQKLEIPVPPEHVLHYHKDAVQQLELIREKLVSDEAHATATFESLLSRAFTGELTAEWEAANAEWIAAQQTLYERLPRLLILALIAEKAKRARRSAEVLVTALMKYVFLFQMEGSASHRRLYHFVPYHYGPFAKELYANLEKLEQDGLISVHKESNEEKTQIRLADPAKAEQILAELPEDFKEDVAAIIETYGDLDHNALLETVYEKHPAYAKKSRLRRRGKRE